MANTLGIDIGASAVKAVVMGAGRAPEVRWARAVARQANGEELGALLRHVRDDAVPPSDSVVTALSGESVPLVFVDLPFTNRKLVERTVAFEVEEHLPAAPEDHELVYQTVATTKQGSRVLTALAPDELIQARLEELGGAQIDPRVVDLDLLALYSCALRIPCSATSRAIVDIGASKTLVVVLDGDALVAARVLRLGGAEVTRSIAASLGLDAEQAEKTKIRHERSGGLSGEVGADEPVEARVVQHAMKHHYGELLDALAVTLGAHERRSGRPVEQVFLVGGGARPAGLARAAGARLGTPTELAPMPTGADLYPESWPETAVAYGLALRGMRGEHGSKVNFRTGDYAYGRELKELTRRFVPLVVPVAIILASLLVSVVVRLVDRGAQVAAIEERIQELYEGAFPNEPIVDVDRQIAQHRGRLEAKIQLLRGPSSPVQVMADLSEAVPRSVESVVDELLLEGNKLTLRGRTRDYGQLDQLRDSLAAQGGFADVRVEEREKTGNEVRFRITARVGHELEEGA